MNGIKQDKKTDKKLEDLKSEVKNIRRELKAYRDKVKNEIRSEIRSSLKNEFLNRLNNFKLEEAEKKFDNELFEDCNRKDECLEAFTKLFEEYLKEIRNSNTDELDSLYSNKREELSTLREEMPFDKCEKCFEVAYHELDKEKRYFEKLNSPKTDSKSDESQDLMSEEILSEVLDPISNDKRIKLLNSLNNESKSFSELSNITDLDGGNLMFHLDKLKEKNFLVQKHRGGEYWLTKKGKKILETLNEIEV